jgi:N-acetylmuramic acid 6-phosphate etherase
VEGAEDVPEDGARAVRDAGVRDRDVVCGIATSGTTPFVLGALEEAARRDSTTALLTCVRSARQGGSGTPADIVIELPVGPEVIAGSTRMKGGTATKMALSMLTTAAMIRWGKVYDNLMVDLRPVNRKLVRRALRLVERLGGVGGDRAAELFRLSGGDVKKAIVMGRRGVDPSEAETLLSRAEGHLRPVIDPPPPKDPPT